MERFRVDRLDGFEWRIFDQSSLALRVHELVILSISFEKHPVAATKIFKYQVPKSAKYGQVNFERNIEREIREIWSGGFRVHLVLGEQNFEGQQPRRAPLLRLGCLLALLSRRLRLRCIGGRRRGIIRHDGLGCC
jgi:hypothetical protein